MISLEEAIAHSSEPEELQQIIATGGAMSLSRRAQGMGLTSMETTLDFEALRDRFIGHDPRAESVCLPTHSGLTLPAIPADFVNGINIHMDGGGTSNVY